MNDTVTKLMALVENYADARAYGGDADKQRQALQDELVKLFTPLTGEQIERMSKVGPVYAPDGWVERRPDEYRREIEGARASGIRIAEQAHGITGESKRCPLCNYQHGHQIGCKNNPVDIALQHDITGMKS